jgi:hypothetical protein
VSATVPLTYTSVWLYFKHDNARHIIRLVTRLSSLLIRTHGISHPTLDRIVLYPRAWVEKPKPKNDTDTTLFEARFWSSPPDRVMLQLKFLNMQERFIQSSIYKYSTVWFAIFSHRRSMLPRSHHVEVDCTTPVSFFVLQPSDKKKHARGRKKKSPVHHVEEPTIKSESEERGRS